uniref:Transmembrane protein 51a n=4 Tax=Nothobranchius TaxID=28779 RepID=A0A1A8MV09_9TELE
MRSSENGPPCSPNGEGVNSNGGNNNSNNNMPRARSEIRGNSGSQYAVCALGVGLIALGVVMIVWSVVPSETSGNNSSSGSGGNSSIDSRRNKASSVAFVLAGSGVAMLLLSLCLGMRNKQREQLRLQELQNQREAAAQEQRETTEEQARRFAVPTYEEAVGSGQYPVRQSNLRPSFSQLPSYDELVQVDGVQYENEGSDVTTQSSGAPDDAVSTTNHRPEKNSLKLLPIKLRRIKSEKLPEKSADVSQPTVDIGVEPLTPPPQYDDKVPPL